MKNKMMKILGIALTLAVLVGLMIPAMPASAGTLSWTTADLPSKFIDGSNITAVGVSPDGGTILVYNGKYDDETEAGDNNGFAKSTDGGISFNAKGLNDPDDEDLFVGPSDFAQIVFSPKFSTDKVIVAVDGTNAYISYDAASSFEALQVDDDTDTGAKFADISYDSNGKLTVLLGTEDSVLLYTEKSGNRWMVLSDAPDFLAGTVLDVQFSPNYDEDAQVLVLSNGGVDTLDDPDVAVLQNAIVERTEEDMNWNQSYKPVVFEVDNDNVAATAGFLAIGDDYNANGGKIFVALDSDDKDEVFRATMSTGVALKKGALMKANDDEDVTTICSMDYEAGKLAIGTDNNIKVNTKADTSTSADDWSNASDETVGIVPSGVTMLVVFGADAESLYAATANYEDVEFGSVFSSSTDYETFVGISLINVENAKLVTHKNSNGIGGAKQYATMTANGGAVQMLFKSTDSGKNWNEIKSNSDGDLSKTFNNLAVFGDVIWIVMKESKILSSSDGGVTFDDTINVRTKDDQILSFAGGPDYWIGGPDGEIYKNNGRTPIVLEDIAGYNIFSLIAIPGFFVIETTSGGPPQGPIYFSGDGGATFKKLSDKDITSVTFDIPGKLIYGLEKGSNDIYSYNVETSTDWAKVGTIAVDGVAFTAANLNLTGNGILYVKGSGDVQFLRSTDIKLSDPKFEVIPESSVVDFKNAAVQPGPTSIVSDDSGNTLYKAVNYLTEDDIPNGKINSKIMTYSDTLAKGPAITAPAANAQISNQYTFQWNAVSAGTKKVTYLFQIATDDKFQGMVEVETTATSTYMVNLVPGKQYYVRVKVLGVVADKTLSSFWSPTIPFIVKLDEVNAANSTWIAPAAGATGVSQTPNFQWNSVTNATGYELVIDGAAPIALTDTVYTMTTPLAYGSTHTWKVRAISGTTAGDWVSGVFTVMEAPKPPAGGTTTVTQPATSAPKFFDPNSGQYFDTQAQLDAFQAAWKTNNPPPTAPSTPAYIWVIIVIGAILVIAVVVLIARTRRV